MKLLFIPVSVFAGLLGGALGRWLFGEIWGVFTDREPPESEHLRASWAQVVIASALKGAVFAGVRAAVDRGGRMAFMGLTGTWPGEEEPEPEYCPRCGRSLSVVIRVVYEVVRGEG